MGEYGNYFLCGKPAKFTRFERLRKRELFVCGLHKENKAAQALGRMAKGVPKNFSKAELERRKKLMDRINARRKRKPASNESVPVK